MDIQYHGNDLNNHNCVDNCNDDPRQNDAVSCRSFCENNYPNAKYFGWVSPSSSWSEGHNTCWCKTSGVKFNRHFSSAQNQDQNLAHVWSFETCLNF